MVYKANPNGTIDLQTNFNKIYVDVGYGIIMNDPKTESLILPAGADPPDTFVS